MASEAAESRRLGTFGGAVGLSLGAVAVLGSEEGTVGSATRVVGATPRTQGSRDGAIAVA